MNDLRQQKYVVYVPERARNSSENQPTITTFMAPSDEAAIEHCREEFKKYWTYRMRESMFSAGGTFWGEVARCARADEGRKIVWSYKQDKAYFDELKKRKY